MAVVIIDQDGSRWVLRHHDPPWMRLYREVWSVFVGGLEAFDRIYAGPDWAQWELNEHNGAGI